MRRIIHVATAGNGEMIMIQGTKEVCMRDGWCMPEWISLSCTPWCSWQQLNVEAIPLPRNALV
eukprot:2638052-Heterocapsa_arctica.AAC.1